MTNELPEKVRKQIERAGLLTVGSIPFVPALTTNKKGQSVVVKDSVTNGPKRGKKGYVDVDGRIWIKDREHAGDPDHWDVQIDGGLEYFRVDFNGNELK